MSTKWLIEIYNSGIPLFKVIDARIERPLSIAEVKDLICSLLNEIKCPEAANLVEMTKSPYER